MAGGQRALVRAVEGAEDSASLGRHALAAKKISARDVVVGLAASGTTPYVLGALRYAKARGAITIAVTCNPRAPLAGLAKILIAPQVGPKVIAGSTRMKAGTSQKLVLNMLSTAAMVRLGYVYDNWMVNVAMGSRKLRQRATRILEQATGASVAEVRRALRQAGHNPSLALVILKTGLGAAAAQRRWKKAAGNLRRALGES
jgi:N-acetylmuramic acid 6-phosphate etherase